MIYRKFHTKNLKNMSNENISIHEFDMQMICEYFSNVERQGPGSPEVTLKALSFIDNLSEDAKIADLGCGTGGQTMVLGQAVSGTMTGLDIFPEFIEKFNQNASKLNLSHRVKGEIGSMFELPFHAEELDLIWAEGSIYHIGYEKGLNEWRKFLKQGGYIAITEASWFTDKRPKEIEDFWMDAYPEIDTIPVKVAQLQQAGYIPVAAFCLPENCWIEHYHLPQTKIEDMFLQKHAGNQSAKQLVEFQRYERQIYDLYKAFYGYVFYIGKKL